MTLFISKYLIILILCCHLSKSKRISIDPEILMNEDQVPFLSRKLSNIFEWFQRNKKTVSERVFDPPQTSPEEMCIIKKKRAGSWLAYLFLFHPYLVIAGFIFSLLRTLIFKNIPNEIVVSLSNSIKSIEDVDMEESVFEYTSTTISKETTDFIPKGQNVSLLTEGFTLDDMRNEKIVVKTQFRCLNPFDTNGVFYYLGCNSSNHEYKNPHLTSQVTVNMQTLFRGSLATVVCHSSNDIGVIYPTYTENSINSWVTIDIGGKKKLIPTHYCIRHGASKQGNALRNWILSAKERSNDEWEILKVHVNDTSLSDLPLSVAFWTIEPHVHNTTSSWKYTISTPHDISSTVLEEGAIDITSGYAAGTNETNGVIDDMRKTKGYRYFLITQTGVNSSNNNCLFIGGIEFYGFLTEFSNDHI